jgi:hypothetical protein
MLIAGGEGLPDVFLQMVDLAALRAKIAAQRSATQALADRARTLVSDGEQHDGPASSAAASSSPGPDEPKELAKTTIALATTPGAAGGSPEAMRSPVTPFGQALRQFGPARTDRPALVEGGGESGEAPAPAAAAKQEQKTTSPQGVVHASRAAGDVSPRGSRASSSAAASPGLRLRGPAVGAPSRVARTQRQVPRAGLAAPPDEGGCDKARFFRPVSIGERPQLFGERLEQQPRAASA